MKNILAYYWDLVASDKSLETLPTQIAMIASIEHLIEYIQYQQDYNGKKEINCKEMIDHLTSIISS